MPINPEGGFETELERDIRMSRKRYANRVYTNANKSLVDQRFRVFHCKRCTSYVLITDADVQAAPRRRTDNAIVFCPEKNYVKLRTKPVLEPVKVRRLKGIETQYLHACADCGLHIAYQSVPHNQYLKNTSPAAVSGDAVSSTPTTTASPASGPSFSPSPASAVSSQTASNAAASVGGRSPFVTSVRDGHELTSSHIGAKVTPSTSPAGVSCGLSITPSASVGHEADGAHVSGCAPKSAPAGAPAVSTDAVTTVSGAALPRQRPLTEETTVSPAAGDRCGVSKQASKKVCSPVSAPLIYLIETAVIFPTKVTQIRMRCRICGFIPRNELQFEEHKRDRGHWDQDSGQFSLQEDSGDTPINPIIVG